MGVIQEPRALFFRNFARDWNNGPIIGEPNIAPMFPRGTIERAECDVASPIFLLPIDSSHAHADATQNQAQPIKGAIDRTKIGSVQRRARKKRIVDRPGWRERFLCHGDAGYAAGYRPLHAELYRGADALVACRR